jgi:phosphatidylserine/phosphatidylglycerophosphate/cardiolipin synthase-like enzyme
MQVYFGGPDKSPRLLRDLLAARVEAVPAGGEILWATYYFRDLDLADALIRARRRGAAVGICIEASPRIRTANRAVHLRFAEDGLGSELTAVSHLHPGHLHEKIYFFSHPSPSAFVGSFNPSGAAPQEVAVVREIGDQDRGHNYLVEMTDPVIVEALRQHVSRLATSRHGILERYSTAANANPTTDKYSLVFFPRRDSAVLLRLMTARPYERIRIAASHFRDGSMAGALARLAHSGTLVEVIAHHTKRRVPERVERALRRAGVRFYRYAHPLDFPMHSKFILMSAPNFRRAVFGSMNLTRTSRWLNHEVLIETSEQALFEAFDQRWEHMLKELRSFSDRNVGDAPSP